MAKASSKKASSSAKYDIIIKAKATTTRIVDMTNETVRLESNDKGQVTGKHYSGFHWDTVEATILADGSATLTIRYLHMTNKGESVMGTGTGTQTTPNQRGNASVTGEGTMWTSAPRLSLAPQALQNGFFHCASYLGSSSLKDGIPSYPSIYHETTTTTAIIPIR